MKRDKQENEAESVARGARVLLYSDGTEGRWDISQSPGRRQLLQQGNRVLMGGTG